MARRGDVGRCIPRLGHTLAGHGWSLSYKSGFCRVIPDFRSSDEQVSSGLNYFFTSPIVGCRPWAFMLLYKGQLHAGSA